MAARTSSLDYYFVSCGSSNEIDGLDYISRVDEDRRGWFAATNFSDFFNFIVSLMDWLLMYC